jgi:beta-glucosidase
VIKRSDFGKDFKWGVSTAAFQIEGAHSEGDKLASVWDVFTAQKGKIHNGHHARLACDFYNLYGDDLSLVQSLSIPNFRFSFSWPRIINADHSVNMLGIAFYDRIIDACLQRGITPWVTLYHWDIPHFLEEKGGWTNRDIVGWFCDYVQVCAKHFGDRVKYWMVMNEPMVFTGAGYYLGIHAPGKKGLSNFIPAMHHATLCQAEGGRLLKVLLPADAEIGTTFSCSHIEPYRNTAADHKAAVKIDALLNRLYIEPVLGLGYPVSDISLLTRVEKYMLSGDEQKMAFDFDFIGVQNYTREIAKRSWLVPIMFATLVGAHKRNVETTLMNWEVYPESIYQMLKKYGQYKGIKKLIVTENGAAFEDLVVNHKVEDTKRVKYLNDYIGQVYRAKQEGVPVEGYFVWTLQDNFEWAEGYRPRFGLIYTDFDTQERIVKDSGYWYRNFLKNEQALI